MKQRGKNDNENEMVAGENCGIVAITAEQLDQLVKTAAIEGAKKGVEAYEKRQEKERVGYASKVHNSAKSIITHYRQLKRMQKTSVCDPGTVTDPTLKEILQGMLGQVRNNEFTLTSTSHNKIVTGMLMNHVDVQLKNYKQECERSKIPDIQRRYRIVDMMYLRIDPLSADEVAYMEDIDKSTVYRTLEKAYDDLSVLFFGVDGVNSIEEGRAARKRKKEPETDS